jgi:aminoglycoside 6'-N-acetyltransferase I
MATGREWARARGCTEFAPDALLDNEVSHATHKALGFEEVVRIVCFKLSDGPTHTETPRCTGA